MEKTLRLIFTVIAALTLSSCAVRAPTRAPASILESAARIAQSPGDPVTSLWFADDQRWLAAGHESGKIEVFDLARGTVKVRIAAHGVRTWVRLSADGRLAFSGSEVEDNIGIWNLDGGAPAHTIASAKGPIVETSDSRFFVVANVGTNSRIGIFDLGRKTLLPTEAQAGGMVTSLAIHPASGLVASGTASGTLETWRFSVEGGLPHLHPLANANPHEAGDWIMDLAFSRDGDRLYSVSRSGDVREWQPGSLSCTRRIVSGLALVVSASFLEGGRMLALSGLADDGTPIGEQVIELRSMDGGAPRLYAPSGNSPVVEFARALNALIVAGEAIVVLPITGPGRWPP